MPVWIVAVGFGTKLVLLLLFSLSIWSVAIMVDRAKVFAELQKEKDLQDARRYIQERNREALAKWASSQRSIYGEAIQRVLLSGARNPQQVEHSIRSYLLDKRGELEQGLTVLATLGSNAPFIGLFGTVLGIIQAFAVLASSNTGTSTGTNTVMSGISEALVATAVGLFVAIPAVIAYNIFSRRLKLVLHQIESLRSFYLSYLD